MNNKPSLEARYADLLNSQDDPALLDLIQDLDALYTTNPIPEQLNHPLAMQPVRLVPPQDAPLSQSGTLSLAPRPPRRWSRLSVQAALLFTVLLVAALAGTFYTLEQLTTAHRGAASTPVVTPQPGITPVPTIGLTATPGVVPGPQACPVAVASPAYWTPIVSPYAYGGSYQVELVSCANIVGISSLQALITVRRADDSATLDIFVFNAITAARPAKIFQLMGLVKGEAKISEYNTVLTAQADELSTLNAGKAVSAMTADLFREFKWSQNTGTLAQTVFPGMFPDMTRYQAEDDQVQVNQGHQPWKLDASQVAINLAVSLLDWSPKATPTLVSGGGTHDVSAVVRVKNTEQMAGDITVTLSRLEGDINSGNIWEVIAVSASGSSITGPATLAQITSPVLVAGTGNAFEGVIGKVVVLDHLYHAMGQASATGVPGMGQASFSATVDYTSTFPAGVQEGMLFLSIPSNANGSIAAAVMEKILIK